MPIDANLGPDGWEVDPIVDKSKLSAAQQANENIKGVAGADNNGGVYDAAGNKVSSGVTSPIGIYKPFPTAGSNVSQVVNENSANVGTTYGKQKIAGNPKRVRARIAHQILRAETYSQSTTAVTVNTVYTGGLAVGDLIYALPTSGNAVSGWYPIASVSAGVSYTYTANDSQTTSGNITWCKGMKGVKVAVALTEVSANATIDNVSSPTVSGTTYNVSADSSNPYGWNNINFNTNPFSNSNFFGTAPSDKALGSANVIPAFGAASDWVTLPSVISDDSKGANFLYRVYHDVVTNGTHSALSGGDLIKINNAAYQNAMNVSSLDWWWTNYQTYRQTVDGINSLTTLPATIVAATGFYIIFEFDYGIPTNSVLFVGDSTTAHGKYEFDYGLSNTVTANFSGSTMTLTANITSSQSGAGSTPYPIQGGQPLTFSGQVNNSDGSQVCVTGLISGTAGQAGAVYGLSASQSTASGVTVTVGVNTIQGWASWCVQACNSKSTPLAPIECFNGGMASKRSHEYLGQLSSALSAGLIPKTVWIQGYSINNSGSPTEYIVNEVKGQILDAIAKCRAAGVSKVLVSTWPLTGVIAGNPTYSAIVNTHNEWVRNLASSRISDGCPDFEAIRAGMGTSAFYSPDGSATYALMGDQIHMGKAAVAAMKSEIKKWI